MTVQQWLTGENIWLRRGFWCCLWLYWLNKGKTLGYFCTPTREPAYVQMMFVWWFTVHRWARLGVWRPVTGPLSVSLGIIQPSSVIYWCGPCTLLRSPWGDYYYYSYFSHTPSTAGAFFPAEFLCFMWLLWQIFLITISHPHFRLKCFCYLFSLNSQYAQSVSLSAWICSATTSERNNPTLKRNDVRETCGLTQRRWGIFKDTGFVFCSYSSVQF